MQPPTYFHRLIHILALVLACALSHFHRNAVSPKSLFNYLSEWVSVELLSMYKKNKNSMWSYGALMVKWFGCVRCLGASNGRFLFLSRLKMWGRWDLWAKLCECEPLFTFAVRVGELFIWFIVVEFRSYEANLYIAYSNRFESIHSKQPLPLVDTVHTETHRK